MLSTFTLFWVASMDLPSTVFFAASACWESAFCTKLAVTAAISAPRALIWALTAFRLF